MADTLNEKETNTKKRVYIGINIDWSESFVDPNGGFYCGTTQEQKDLAAKLMPFLDLVVYNTDFHAAKSKEFAANGGLWPFHNVAEYKTVKVEDLGLKPGTTISPRQTKTIDDVINKTKQGIVVPKHVYYQDGEEPAFLPKDVEDAFDAKIITPAEFIKEDFTYVIALKMVFDGTYVAGDFDLPVGMVEDMPKVDYTVFDLLKKKYPAADYDIVLVNTGVVDNICRHYTSVGEVERFRNHPGTRIINTADATTQLAGIGFEDRKQVKDAMKKLAGDLAIEYKTVDQVIDEIKAYKLG